MKLTVIGATGFVGPYVVSEALTRGHEVTAIARNVDKIELKNGLTVKSIDVNDISKLAEALKGEDAVVSTFNAGWGNPNLYNDFLKGAGAIQAAVKDSDVKRLLVVGGAGSLYIDGKQLVDSPEFPAQFHSGATAARDYLTALKNESALDWTYLSPAMDLHPGERTGVFRIGTENPVFSTDGQNSISVEDLAKAVVDELENNEFIQKRFTVGY
jgi:putative NADH-flavin reductase